MSRPKWASASPLVGSVMLMCWSCSEMVRLWKWKRCRNVQSLLPSLSSQVSFVEFYLLSVLGTNQMWASHIVTVCIQFKSRLGIATEKSKRKSAVKGWCSGYACEASSVFVGLVNRWLLFCVNHFSSFFFLNNLLSTLCIRGLIFFEWQLFESI